MLFQKGHYYLQRAVTPDQITQQNSLQRAGAPKGRKGTLRPDFQANTRPRIFFKAKRGIKISFARIFRSSFRENKPKMLVFSHRKRAYWACFHENWVYKFGHRILNSHRRLKNIRTVQRVAQKKRIENNQVCGLYR